MKIPLKKTATVILFLSAILFLGVSCDNDSDPSPNDNQCNYQGLTFLDTSNNTQTLILETDLTTDFFPNGLGAGVGQVEIYKTANPGQMNFVTGVVTQGATGAGTLMLNGTNYNVTVTCQRAGTTVGDEFRFDVTASGVEAEFCVIIDNVSP